MINSDSTFKILVLHSFWNCVSLPCCSWERGSHGHYLHLDMAAWHCPILKAVTYILHWHTDCFISVSFCVRVIERMCSTHPTERGASLVLDIRWRREFGVGYQMEDVAPYLKLGGCSQSSQAFPTSVPPGSCSFWGFYVVSVSHYHAWDTIRASRANPPGHSASPKA